MADFGETLSARAEEFHEARQSLAHTLRVEIDELEDKLTKLRNDLVRAEHSGDRLAVYQPKIADAYQCPQCWVGWGLPTSLVNFGSPNADGLYECGECPFTEHRSV